MKWTVECYGAERYRIQRWQAGNIIRLGEPNDPCEEAICDFLGGVCDGHDTFGWYWTSEERANWVLGMIERAWPSLNKPERAQRDFALCLDGLGEYERIVAYNELRDICDRLRLGQQQYGAFDPATDTRDWDKEMREERLDGAVYAGFKRVQEEMKRNGGE
jgi:hypothetical protein